MAAWLSDTSDERFGKRLLVGVTLVILPVRFLWGWLYWAAGEHAVALTPWAYVTGSAAIIVRTPPDPERETILRMPEYDSDAQRLAAAFGNLGMPEQLER